MKSTVTRAIEAATDAAFGKSETPNVVRVEDVYPPWWTIPSAAEAYTQGLCVICKNIPQKKGDEFYCEEHRKRRDELVGGK